MAFNVQHNVDPGLFMSAIAAMAARQEQQRQAKQQLDQAEQQQRIDASQARTTLERDQFDYNQSRDAAQRQHAIDALNTQHDRLDQRDQANFDRLPERLQMQAEASADAQDRKLTTLQNREMARLDQAEVTLYTDPSFTDEERLAGLEQIERRRKSVKTASAVSAQSPYPKGQDIGDLWEAQPGSGLWISRNSKGEIVLINRMDQQDLKLADFTKLYDSAAASLTGPNGEPPDPAAVEARVQAQLSAFQKIKAQSRGQAPGSPTTPGGMPGGNPMPDVGPSSNPVTGPNFQGTPLPPPVEAGSTPQTMGDVRMRDAELAAAQSMGPTPTATPTPDQLRQQEQDRRASLVPPTHWITKLPAAQRLPSKVANVDSFTPAELSLIAIQKNMPIDMVIAKLVGGDIALRHGQQTAPTRQRRYDQEQRP